MKEIKNLNGYMPFRFDLADPIQENIYLQLITLNKRTRDNIIINSLKNQDKLIQENKKLLDIIENLSKNSNNNHQTLNNKKMIFSNEIKSDEISIDLSSIEKKEDINIEEKMKLKFQESFLKK